jgi:hypothetical protein
VLAAPIGDIMRRLHAAASDAQICVGEVGLTPIALRMSAEIPEACSTLGSELRNRAVQVLNLTAPNFLPAPPTLEVFEAQLEPTARVFFTKHAKYRDANGHPTLIEQFSELAVPLSVAEKAYLLGVGVDPMRAMRVRLDRSARHWAVPRGFRILKQEAMEDAPWLESWLDFTSEIFHNRICRGSGRPTFSPVTAIFHPWADMGEPQTRPDLVGRLSGAITALTRDGAKGSTWRLIPAETGDKRDLLIASLAARPLVPNPPTSRVSGFELAGVAGRVQVSNHAGSHPANVGSTKTW